MRRTRSTRPGQDPSGGRHCCQVHIGVNQSLTGAPIERGEGIHSDLDMCEWRVMEVCRQAPGHSLDEIGILSHHHFLPGCQIPFQRQFPSSACGRVKSEEFRVTGLFDNHDLPGTVKPGAGPGGRFGSKIGPERQRQLRGCVDAQRRQKETSRPTGQHAGRTLDRQHRDGAARQRNEFDNQCRGQSGGKSSVAATIMIQGNIPRLKRSHVAT